MSPTTPPLVIKQYNISICDGDCMRHACTSDPRASTWEFRTWPSYECERNWTKFWLHYCSAWYKYVVFGLVYKSNLSVQFWEWIRIHCVIERPSDHRFINQTLAHTTHTHTPSERTLIRKPHHITSTTSSPWLYSIHFNSIESLQSVFIRHPHTMKLTNKNIQHECKQWGVVWW